MAYGPMFPLRDDSLHRAAQRILKMLEQEELAKRSRGAHTTTGVRAWRSDAVDQAAPANAAAVGRLARPLVRQERSARRPGMQFVAGVVPAPAPMPLPLPLPPVAIPGTKENDEFVRQGQQLYDWLRNAFQRSFSGGGGSDPDDDEGECYRRWQAEERRCGRWPKKWYRDCKRRAFHRHNLCVGNGGRPHAEEPPEWGPGDMETWYNPYR